MENASIEYRNRYYDCLTEEMRKAPSIRAKPSLAGLNAQIQMLVRAGCSSDEWMENASIEYRNRYYDCLTEEIRKARGGN